MRYRPWWLLRALVPCLLVLTLTSSSHAGLTSSRRNYIDSADCAGLANQPGIPLCVQQINGELVQFGFGESGFYVRPGGGGAATDDQTLAEVCTSAANCKTANADTVPICGASSADADLRVCLGVESSIPGVRAYDASGTQLTFDDAVFSGQNKSTTIDNGSGTQTSCIDVSDAGITDYSANESCGAQTNVRYWSPRAHDSPPPCTGAGHNFQYFDLSELRWKVCEEGVLSNLLGAFDPTTLGATTTWGDGSQASMTWTWNVSGTDTSIAFGSAIGTFTGNWDATGRVQGSKLRLSTTTCLDLSGDRIFHDTDCDTTKDAGEEFIDLDGDITAVGTCTSGACTLVDADVPDTITVTREMTFGCNDAAGQTSFMIPGFDSSSCPASELINSFRPVKTTMTATKLDCQITGAAGQSAVWTFTYRENAADTALACSITDPATTCSDTDSIGSVSGDVVGMSWTDSTANDDAIAAMCIITYTSTQ